MQDRPTVRSKTTNIVGNRLIVYLDALFQRLNAIKLNPISPCNFLQIRKTIIVVCTYQDHRIFSRCYLP